MSPTRWNSGSILKYSSWLNLWLLIASVAGLWCDLRRLASSGHRLSLGQGPFLRDVGEHHLELHPVAERVVIALDDVRDHPDAFSKLDDCRHIRQISQEGVRHGGVVHRVGEQRGSAGGLDPAEF